MRLLVGVSRLVVGAHAVAFAAGNNAIITDDVFLPDAPNILVVAGPSGVGKSTLLQNLIKRHPKLFDFSVSYTTRDARAGEQDGKDYNFVSREEFENRIFDGDMFEHAEVVSNYYGTATSEVMRVIESGMCCVFDVDTQGADQIRNHFKNDDRVKMEFVFVLPPSLQELERRLRGRGTESEAAIRTRLQAAPNEIQNAERSAYWKFLSNEDGKQENVYQKLCRIVGIDAKPSYLLD